MIVLRSRFTKVLEHLAGVKDLALDSETTGLLPYHGDFLFSLILADERESFYFNFQGYPDADSDHVLSREEHLQALKPLLEDPDRTWRLANAKFDMHFLAREGLLLAGRIHCTEVAARLEYNDHLTYSLDACAERALGVRKDDQVKAYVRDHHLWEWEQTPGKKTRSKRLFFNRVPLEIIAPYGEKDARLTFDLARHQKAQLEALAHDAKRPPKLPALTRVHDTECRLTRTCFRMERTGVRVDREYCERAIRFEDDRARIAAREFERVSGETFVDSNQALTRAFAKVGEKPGRTEKGNPSFTDEVLSELKSPLAALVQTYRDASKKANTYYRNFLYFSDHQGFLHANIRQAGTATGRFSYSDPNLQNLNKEEGVTSEFRVRRSFRPRPGNVWVSIDYKAMEFRMMVDYAKQRGLAERIKAGLDPHDETAKMTGLSRKQAKTLNFGLLYGMGIEKLGLALDIPYDEARSVREQYFAALPEVQEFIRSVMRAAQINKRLFNWAGRIYHFPNPDWAFKGPNYLIQGGCSDVVKIAMNQIDDLLSDRKSKMIIQVHDSIELDMDPHELHLVKEITGIMENVYPAKMLPLEVSVGHSWESWGDVVDGLPI